MERRIMSTWQQETGVWNSAQNQYHCKKCTTYKKSLTMELYRRAADEKIILKFNGGPTGFESYQAEGMLDRMLADQIDKPADRPFYICAGTINSWPAVSVNMAEVVLFLADAKIAGVLK